MANTIEFAVQAPDGRHTVTPRIDSVLLTDAVEAFETGMGYGDPAGGYGGLIPSWFNYGPLDVYFRGACADFLGMSPGRIYVLGCACGEVGCWPLEAVVTAGTDTVCWSGFAQFRRPGRDYSAFGPFIFDRRAYEKALDDLLSALLT